MLIEELELTPAHVDLGTLTEYSAMVLFGTAFCHHLTQGTKLAGIREIRDAAGSALYPANFLTQLTVPPKRLLEEHQVWDRVSVGAEVKSFGRMILDSSFVLGLPGEIPTDLERWDTKNLPAARFGSLFIVEDRRAEPESSVPMAGHLADLPALTSVPASAARFEAAQNKGGQLREYDGNLALKEPLRHSVIAGRDLAAGHAVMFATFVRIMDLAERALLGEHLFPALHQPLLDRLHVLDRETFYLGNCFAGDRLRIDVKGKVLPSPAEIQLKSIERVPAALFELVFEIYNEAQNALLVISKVKKLLIVPRTMKVARREAERFLYQYGTQK